MTDSLARVTEATRKRQRALTALDSATRPWQQAIRDAVTEGHSLRTVGKAAGISNVRVLQITRR